MKNINVGLFCLFFLVSSKAQDLQRLAIPVQHISIPAGSGRVNTEPVTSFCIDFNRYSKFNGKDDYSHITLDAECVKIGQNAPITLQDALDQGKIKMEVNHYDDIVFTNRTNQPVEIDVSKDIVLGKDKNDTKNLVIPPIFGQKGAESQNDIWIKQSLVYMGFLDKDKIGDKLAVSEAKQKYINSAWKSYGRIPAPTNTEQFSGTLKEHSRILQYAEAGKFISRDKVVNITVSQIGDGAHIGVNLFAVAHDIPEAKDWPGAYYLYKSTDNEYLLFDPQYRLLVKTKDERELAKAYAETGEKASAMPIVGGGGNLNERQGDAIAAAMELGLRDAGLNCRLYYIDADAVRENAASVKAVLSDENSNKLKRQLSAQQISPVGNESQVISDYVNKTPEGTVMDVQIAVRGADRTAVKGYIAWANQTYRNYRTGSLFADVRNYFLRSKLKGYIKFMKGRLRISKIPLHPSTEIACSK